MNLNFLKGDEHKPLAQRKMTWAVIAVIILGCFVGGGINKVRKSLVTETVTARVLSRVTECKISVEKWTAERKYNRSSVPSCAWDEDEDTYYVCDWRDSTGICISGHYETDYDFNVMAWVDFKHWEEEWVDEKPTDALYKVYLDEPKKFKVNVRRKYRIHVATGQDSRWFYVKNLPATKEVLVRIRKKSRNLVSYVE